ncbi:hypothetical protein [Streptomyces rimosus]|uniref:hypothetical protein n=1 Tax=Streptomyces rimosus TaxID=1927 RepID=UPI000A8470EF|nr:hypothetical protein [Streptomyces rimosus]
MLTFTAKLAHLLKRRPGPDGKPISTRALSEAIRSLPGHARGGSVQSLANLRKGEDTNPTLTTVEQLATVLDAPAPFLLPGWDDIQALTVIQHSPRARDVLRHLDGLPLDDLDALVQHLQERREQLGLAPAVPLEEIETDPSPESDTAPRRRKRTMKQAARYAADSLEGRKPAQ